MSHKVFATAQAPDYLIYKGDTLSIFTNPLEKYFEDHFRPDSLFSERGFKTTDCWRGYVSYWELQNDSLFLLEVHGFDSKIKLSEIIKDRSIDGEIFADWFSGSILNPNGDLIHYEHSGYLSIYEFENEFYFKNGILIAQKIYDNSKSKISKYTRNPNLLREYIKNNIDYSTITINPTKKALVVVQILGVTADGKIDYVKVIKSSDDERDQEAIRVVKSIPEWDVIYKHGELYNMVWTIPVVFEEKMEPR